MYLRTRRSGKYLLEKEDKLERRWGGKVLGDLETYV
jgi:hypothetical protein